MMKKRLFYVALVLGIVLQTAGCGYKELTGDEPVQEGEYGLELEAFVSGSDVVDDESDESDKSAKDTAVAEEEDNTNIAEETDEEVTDEKTSADTLFAEWIEGKRTVKEEEFGSEYVYAELTDSSLEWEMYSNIGTEDIDSDGEPELLLSGPYGLMIVDARDNELYVLAEGNGMGGICALTKYNDSWWVLSMDASHAGREMYDMKRYESGRLVETTSLYAEYWDNENDKYDENSDFSLGGKKITMAEFESIRDEIKAAMIR